MPKPQTGAGLEVARFKAAFQQQDGAAPVERAQAFGFVNIKQRKTVSAFEAGKRTLDAMTIRIGLDDGPHFGIRRGAFHAQQIVGKGLGVDGGLDGARHKR